MGFAPQQPMGAYPWQAYIHLSHGLRSMLGCAEWLLYPLPQVGRPYGTESAVLQPFQLYGGVYNSGDLVESHLISSSSLQGWEGSFPGLVPPNDKLTLNWWWSGNLSYLVW